MKLNRQSKDFYKHFRFIIIPVVFLGFYLLAFLVDPYRPWSHYFSRSVSEIIIEWVFVLIFCGCITEMSLIVSRKLDVKLPWMLHPVTRILVQFTLQIISTILFLYVYMQITMFIFDGNVKHKDVDAIARRQAFAVSLLLSLLISIIYTGNFFLQKWKGAMLETAELNLRAAELKRIALEAQLESLKAQLDPHFMFNNFSTLSALITEDQNLAQHFLENLSRVYRYMVINLNKNIITLEEEIKFAEAYFYLIKIRLGDNVKLEINISKEIVKKGIPPITLQLLIENAIKHNMACRDKPLLISISTDEHDNLIITNSLQRLNYNIPSTGTGLKNIDSRYSLLSDKNIEVSENENLFIVKIPLLSI
jgi:two-component system LytT family sensor kinase